MRRNALRQPNARTLRIDAGYVAVLGAMTSLLLHYPVVRKTRVLTTADVPSWRGYGRWATLVHFMEDENPNSIILPLMDVYFLGKNNQRRLVASPRQFIAPNFTIAAGFADLAPFAALNDESRSIALARYSLQEIVAAKALERAQRLSDAIALPAPAQVEQLV